MEKLDFLAPCGLNCALCAAYQREKKPCAGCNGGILNKSKSCLECKIKNCPELNNEIIYCFQCQFFPCLKVKNLDKRYKKYHASPINNLKIAQEIGVLEFIKGDLQNWKCKKCGQILCMHNNICPNCNFDFA
jgi:Protein of unknown function (DUF3795)